MRVAIQTLGTRGDVQPYIALALGLMERGHEVQIAAPVQFEAMVSGRGIAFAALPGEFLALIDTPEGKAALVGAQGFGAGLKLLKHVRPLMRSLLDAEWAALRAFALDVIIGHPKSLAAPHRPKLLDVPISWHPRCPGLRRLRLSRPRCCRSRPWALSTGSAMPWSCGDRSCCLGNWSARGGSRRSA